MYCHHCGSAIPDGTKFCPSCGAQTNAAQPQQTQGTAPPQQQQPVQNQQPYQQPYGGQGYEQPNNYAQGYNQPYGQQTQAVYQPVTPYVLPMKWYKFLIYFALFAGAVVDIISAICSFAGTQYEMTYAGSAEAYYYYFKGLQALDIIYGIMLIALAVLLVYVRFRLSGYKKNGPKLLIISYAASLAVTLIYYIAFMIIVVPTLASLGSSTAIANVIGSSVGSVIGTAVGTIIVIIVNKVYFDKRQHLFVN